ncbi:MAG: hypothetical protein ACYTGR_03570 [Planctomycetota bacterium]|jgi:hypothetical protein
MSAHCPSCNTAESSKRPRRFRPVGTLFQLALVYLLLIFSGGTLQNTGHPVAVEAGKLIHTITLVDPAIRWADRQGIEPVAMGLHVLSNGLPI